MKDIYSLYNEAATDGPFIRRQGFQGSVLYVVGHQEAKQILGDSKRFVKDMRNTLPAEQRRDQSSGMGIYDLMYNNMLNYDAPDHTRLRSLVSKAFTNRQIQALAPRIQEIADELIDGFEYRGQVDLIDAYAFPLPIIVICELLGVPSADRHKFRKWSQAFIGIADDDYAYMRYLQEFLRYISQMVEERRARPSDDLISALVHTEEDGQRLSEQELFSMIALLIVAGHETTVNLIGNGMLALLQHPDQAALLRRDSQLIEGAIEEFLRYAGPVEMTTQRYAAEDIEISGTLIQRGTPVVIVLAAANRDPQFFQEGSALDITRQGNRHMGFGYGVHYCLGAPLARLEAHIAFNTLLQRLPNLQLAVPADQLTTTTGTIIRGLQKLPIYWQP